MDTGDARLSIARRLAGLLGALVLLASALPAAAKPLRVVADNNYPPYLFLNAEGKPEGYLVDLWQLWARKTGVPVDLDPMQWAAAQQAMRDGQADAIDMIFRTPVREQLYDFSRAYADLTASIYVNPAIQGIHDAHAMKGFEVGVQRGDACIEQLAAEGVTTLKAYPDYESMLAGARAGEIKMFCMDDLPANYYLYLHRGEQGFSRAFTLYNGRFHWAVAKGDTDTFALIERGMAAITPAEREALRKKWLTQPLQFRPYLRILSWVLLGALVVVAATLLWIRALRRAVRARTAEIRQKNTQLESAARALVNEQAQLRLFFDSSPDVMALKDGRGVYLHCNAGLETLLGLKREEILGHTDAQLFPDKDFVAFIRAHDEEVLRSGRQRRYEETVVAADGGERHLEVIKVPLHRTDGEISGVLAVARDITERRRIERELRIASVAFESQDGMMITDAQGNIERVNAAFTRISGYPAVEAVGRNPRFLQAGLHDPAFYETMWSALTSIGYWHGEVANRHKDGSLYSARLSITAVRDAQGRTQHYVGSLQDISGEKRALALAEHMRRFDPLTELPNRSAFAGQLDQALAASGASHEFGAILMLDLDHFQRINDSLGHAAGDRVLVEISARLQALKRENDVLARFSADSFVMLCERLGPERHVAAGRAADIAECVRDAIGGRAIAAGRRVVCTASVGLSLFRGAQASPDTLVRRAELAMYKSKKEGRNTVRFFEEEMQAELDDRNWIEGELREAIAREQLVLYYQLQVDRDGRSVGAEALVRWRHPERGLISPAAFISLAEETGLVVPLGRWALATACRQLALWKRRESMRHLTLAVNISPLQFKAESFVQDILDEVERHGAPIDKLKLEVTESLAIDDFRSSISKLNSLKELGFKISLDDFGTGNSSLNYLTKLPLTQLKIDKSFVDELPASERDAMVAQTIIAMGKGLGLDVIAEGVENAAQRDFLVGHGCHAFQGYLFAKPLPLAEFEALFHVPSSAMEIK